MLMLLSPAKTLDFQSSQTPANTTQPLFIDQATQLIKECAVLTPVDIAKLMKVSDKIASLNVARFAQWQPQHDSANSRAAVLAFKGDVYTGLDAQSLSAESLDFAQLHVRILSGLYGTLRPLDLMQPYRLEMGTKLHNSRGTDLYQFWGNRITDAINQALSEQQDNILINLASNEYFKSVKHNNIKGEVITPVFKDLKNGQYKIISFYAKKARGMMARFIIENKLTTPEQLTAFDTAGYYYSASESTEREYVFKRDTPA